MATSISITGLPVLTPNSLSGGDILPIVDVSDLTDPTGTTKRITLAGLNLNNAAFNILNYGGDATGTTSSNAALTAILALITGTTNAVILLPAGTYFLNDFPFAAAANLTIRGVPGATTITGKTRVVNNFSNPSLHGTVSQRIGQFTGASNIVFEDITFDGQQPSGPTYYAANYPDVKALLEFRTSTHIRLTRCSFINFTPAGAVTSSGGNPNPDPIEAQNLGPIFMNGCDDVKLLDTKLLAPCYGEGFTIMNSTTVYVDRMYSNAGIPSGQYGTSTPLHVMGPTTKFVTVTNCHWYQANGSSLELGGIGSLSASGNTVNGGGGYNIALANLGYYNDWDLTGIGLQITGNRFTNMIADTGSKIPGIYIGSRTDGGFQFQDVQVLNNTFDAVFSCISVKGCQDVVIANNQGSRLYVSTSSPAVSEGTGILVDGCVGVTLADCRMDMSVVPNSGTSTNRALYGMIVQDSEDVICHDNQCIDGKTNNIRLTVQDVYQLNFTGGGTFLRDTLFNLDWFGTAYTVTGQSSGATLILNGRVLTSGAWVGNTAAGYIYGITKTGTFTNGESLQLNATTNCAVATGDASFYSWMNRISVHDNQSATLTSTTTPYFIQPVNANAMVGQYMRSNNLHSGQYIDPLDVALNVGDTSITLTNNSLPTVQFLSTLTANRTVTIPASSAFNGQKFVVLIGAASAFTVTVRTSTPTTLLVIPVQAMGKFVFQYNQGWRAVEQSYFPVAAALASTAVTLTNGASAQVATLTNGPTAGNPTKWFPINDNGTVRYVPAW